MLLLAAFLTCSYSSQGRNGVILEYHTVLVKQLQIKIPSALLFLFIPITTKNKITLDGSAVSECAQQACREFSCIPLMGILGDKGGKVEGIIVVNSIL